MKKLILLFAVLALVPVLVPAEADTATLRQRLTKVEGKLNCLRRVPVTEFSDFAAYGDPSPTGDNSANTYATTANTTLDPTAVDNPDGLRDFGAVTGLDWDFGDPVPDLWVLAIRAYNNSSNEYVPYPGCAARFGLQPTPIWWSRAARLTHLRQLARVQ